MTKDFTVRDLNRHLSEVLDACNRLGSVVIRARSGDTYELRRHTPKKKSAKEKKAAYPDFAARRKAIGMPMMTKAQSEALDRLIAGE
ncbi:MAG: hypothetical protein ABI680_12760 [Chthoniobacteraceae bacterium]